MKSYLKLTALLLALLSVALLSACSGVFANRAEDESVVMEDGEDVGFEQAKVMVANLTGRDAVELLVRVSGGQWSANVLTEGCFHTNTQIEITYAATENARYDLRFVYEDGSHRDFTDLDFDDARSVFYLGADDESSTK